MQHVYERRGHFGGSVLRAVELFFPTSSRNFPVDFATRAQFCKEILKEGRPFYELVRESLAQSEFTFGLMTRPDTSS